MPDQNEEFDDPVALPYVAHALKMGGGMMERVVFHPAFAAVVLMVFVREYLTAGWNQATVGLGAVFPVYFWMIASNQFSTIPHPLDIVFDVLFPVEVAEIQEDEFTRLEWWFIGIPVAVGPAIMWLDSFGRYTNAVALGAALITLLFAEYVVVWRHTNRERRGDRE